MGKRPSRDLAAPPRSPQCSARRSGDPEARAGVGRPVRGDLHAPSWPRPGCLGTGVSLRHCFTEKQVLGGLRVSLSRAGGGSGVWGAPFSRPRAARPGPLSPPHRGPLSRARPDGAEGDATPNLPAWPAGRLLPLGVHACPSCTRSRSGPSEREGGPAPGTAPRGADGGTASGFWAAPGGQGSRARSRRARTAGPSESGGEGRFWRQTGARLPPPPSQAPAAPPSSSPAAGGGRGRLRVTLPPRRALQPPPQFLGRHMDPVGPSAPRR